MRVVRSKLALLLALVLLASLPTSVGSKAGKKETCSPKIRKALFMFPFESNPGYGHEEFRPAIDAVRGAGYEVELLYNEEVKPETFLKLPEYGIVFIDTHGGAWNDKSGEERVALATGIRFFIRPVPSSRYLQENYPQYREDLGAGRVYLGSQYLMPDLPLVHYDAIKYRAVLGITDKYISHYLRGKTFPNTLIYIFACEALANGALDKAFDIPGLISAIGFKRHASVGIFGFMDADVEATNKFFEVATQPNKTVRQAYDEAAKIAGSDYIILEDKDYELVLNPMDTVPKTDQPPDKPVLLELIDPVDILADNVIILFDDREDYNNGVRS